METRPEPILNAETASAVATYVMAGLSGSATEGWVHSFCSGHQMACELLDALGYAIETDWGAVPVPEPVLPKVLPRWDDTCAALLAFAAQNGAFETSTIDERAQVFIAPGHGMGFAGVHVDLHAILLRLGLIRNGSWTVHARNILWRTWPYEWPDPDFGMIPDLMRAEQDTFDSIPRDVLHVIDKALADDDVTLRRFWVERLLSHRWRYPDGWLDNADESPRALHIFHDPLATWMAMRLTVRREQMR